MALTRIQPSGVDQTLDYSVHKLTVSGVDVLGYAQSAFLQANTDYTNVSATAGVYGGSTNIPVVTLAANGRVSSITNTSISIPASYTDTNVATYLPTYTGNISPAIVKTNLVTSTGGSSSIELSDIGIISINPSGGSGTGPKFVGKTIEISSVYGGTYGLNKLSVDNETKLSSLVYDSVKIVTGADQTEHNTWNFANNQLIFPDGTYQNTAWTGTDAFARTTANTAVLNAVSAGSYANAAFIKANTFSYPSSGIANSDGSAWSTSYSTTGTGSVLSLNTSPVITNPTITNYVETPYVVNSSTALTIDLSNGTVQVVTLTGSPTITMPTAVSGKSFIMYMKTGSGSYTVTWSTVKWPAATAPTITSTASKMDIFSFFSDGTNWYGVTVGQNYTP